MNASLVLYQKNKALPKPSPAGSKAIRRIFDNSQLIERFDKWLLVCGKAAHTRKNYTSDARQFAKFIEKPLTAATKEDVRDWIGSLFARNAAPSTMQRKLDALRVFFDCLQLGSQVRVSVTRLIPRRKLPRHLPRVLSEEEIKRLIAAARTPRDLAILELGYASGLRVNELAHLRIEDVNLKGRSLIVRQGKGGDDRIALFGRPAADALRQYIRERISGPLFLQHPRHQRGSLWIDRQWTARWYGKWCETNDSGKRVMRKVSLGRIRELPTKERARAALDAYLRNTNRLPEH